MAINKVEYGGRSLIDLTADTVAPENLLAGETAHNKAGEAIVGKAKRQPVVQSLYVTRNGNYTPPEGVDGYAPVRVQIPSDRKPEQTKTVTITQNGDVTITPDAGNVLSRVVVEVSVASKDYPKWTGGAY